jgi:nucleotide-binding universal stress UspA family protein
MPGIVVGVDGSAQSRKALEWALAEAAQRKAPLTAVGVGPVASSIFGLSAQHYPADEVTQKHVQDTTEKFVAEVTGGTTPDVTVTVKAVTGLPAEELIRASADADLLVVGARGLGGFGRLMMGSVSSQVAHHATCPVVVIPAEKER